MQRVQSAKRDMSPTLMELSARLRLVPLLTAYIASIIVDALHVKQDIY